MKGSQRGPPTHQHNFVMSDVLNSNFVSEESEHEMVSRLTGVAEARPNCSAQTVGRCVFVVPLRREITLEERPACGCSTTFLFA